MSKKDNATIIYYTSNREDEGFESRVRENILKVNKLNLPIISISHKPIDFGKNICVGDVGTSGFNMFRQVQIGLLEVKTDFAISAEADCLYPPDYFEFRPKQLNRCYRNNNLYVMPDRRDFYFYKKEGATHAQIVGTKYYLETLNKLFKDAPKWSVEEKNFPKERHKQEDIFNNIYYWTSKNPVFQIKTHRGMRYYTHSDRTPIPKIDYWGGGKKARRYFLHGLKD